MFGVAAPSSRGIRVIGYTITKTKPLQAYTVRDFILNINTAKKSMKRVISLDILIIIFNISINNIISIIIRKNIGNIMRKTIFRCKTSAYKVLAIAMSLANCMGAQRHPVVGVHSTINK